MDYHLCNQTVTIYHHDKDAGTYTKTVIEEGAFLDFRKNHNVEKTGMKESNSFLLVIPCWDEIQPVFPDDKVLLGEGQDVSTREDWSALIPSQVPGLVVVKYVDPKYWKGRLVHVEAGG